MSYDKTPVRQAIASPIALRSIANHGNIQYARSPDRVQIAPSSSQ
ncbi:hypothetical protein [Microcoleus sp. bin38.metabat.b11b12b14.051]|nr:hypothetical protein [Microcoleus sp. bin38.metabat.b11b12b14.051]